MQLVKNLKQLVNQEGTPLISSEIITKLRARGFVINNQKDAREAVKAVVSLTDRALSELESTEYLKHFAWIEKGIVALNDEIEENKL